MRVDSVAVAMPKPRKEFVKFNNSDDDDLDDEEDEEEILPLDDDESDEDDEDSEDEGEGEGEWDEDDDAAGGAGDSDDDDASSDGDGDGAAPARASSAGWGKSRRGFYGGDDAGDDEDAAEAEEAARLEQQEVLRLQKEQAARLRLDDFGELAAPKASSRGAPSAEALDDELQALARGGLGASVRVESLERDLRGMSEREKLQHVRAEAPELQQLLADFKGHVKEAREVLQPLLADARARRLPTEGGVGFVQLKLQLLLSYCSNIAFYLLLKCNGQPVRDHPVVDALLRHRLLIQRLKPIEAKHQYRVRKLLELAASEENGGGGLSAAQADLQHRPRPDLLLPSRDGDGDADGDDDGIGAGGGAAAAVGAYRPPRLAAVPYEEERGAAKRERRRLRDVQRASDSRLVRELRAEVSEAPERYHADDFGGRLDSNSQAVQRVRREEDELREYEEANLQRLQLTKEQRRDQKKRRRQPTFADELAGFDDFSHLSRVAADDGADDFGAEREKALKQYLNSIEQRAGGKKGRRSADDDVPRVGADEKAARHEARAAARQRKAAAAADDDDDYGGGGGGAPPEEDPFYAQVRDATAGKKQRRTDRASAAAAAAADEEASAAAAARASRPKDSAEPGEKREAGRQIERNRGLTRERKKIDRNPRVKNREKFRRATIKRKGQVREVREAEGGSYAGEASGIRKGVSHSRKFAK